MTSPDILRRFDAAAARYDQAALAQAKIAARLVAWAAESGIEPASILDIGSGTGLVAEEAQRRWPQAQITALDASPAMLKEAQRKMPQLSVMRGDILTAAPSQKFDALFSSMALHWLPDPRGALRRWQSWLKPQGKLFVALPVEGSFQEWRELCQKHSVSDGLWPLPRGDFADGIAARTSSETITIAYPSARDFLRSMKATGAATPRPDHKPVNVAQMRAALNASRQPLNVSYQLLFLVLQAKTPTLDP
jgi:malonyl-CoA O-methyltransferase